jgi:hypothetical protein
VWFAISIRVTSIEMVQLMNRGRAQKVKIPSKQTIVASPGRSDLQRI